MACFVTEYSRNSVILNAISPVALTLNKNNNMDNKTFRHNAAHFVENLQTLEMQIDQQAETRKLADDLDPLSKIATRLARHLTESMTTDSWREAVDKESQAIRQIIADARSERHKKTLLNEIEAYLSDVKKPTDNEVFVEDLKRLSASTSDNHGLNQAIEELSLEAKNVTSIQQAWNILVGKHYEPIWRLATAAREGGTNDFYPHAILKHLEDRNDYGERKHLEDKFNYSSDGKYFSSIGVFASWLNDREGVNLKGLTEKMDAVTQRLKNTPHDNLDEWRDAVREDSKTVLAALNAVEKLGIRLPAYAKEIRDYLGSLGVKEEQSLGRGK